MIDDSEKRNRQLALELQNSHVCEKRSKKPIYNIIKFWHCVKPTQRHDDIIISTRNLFIKIIQFFYSHYLLYT